MQVTKHAVERYIERIEPADEETARQALEEAAHSGRVIFERPCSISHEPDVRKECYMEYNGMYIVAYQDKKGEICAVITCLGDDKRFKWFFKERKRANVKFTYSN